MNSTQDLTTVQTLLRPDFHQWFPVFTREVTGNESRYGEPVLMALYRPAQEGITNARRHAGATEIGVSVRLGEAEARLTVSDNGSGFAPEREGFGLRGIRERVQLVGGSLSVQSRGSTGTRLMVVVPRQQSAT